ncbi:MAG TPA: 4-(cytidine 5'-diphospho)-2-C-methyl-D-erythritol kinase [Pyrinomonadaceae bacterium]|nr:4-(cytidine 5'-diphospho)-2-C-methyl-D-erythritol kinase [Pyrinomonadaceae bacterium]
MKNTSLKLPSFAKINSFLRILGLRSDGYHDVVTLLQTISLHDDLGFELREDDQVILHCDDPAIPVDETNLVVKAALALRKQLQSPLGAEITLTKRIPAQGGLGGASSNAAVTLFALNALWRGDLRADQLWLIGRGLGVDVPFFLVGGRCIGIGTGSIVKPVHDPPKRPLIVVTPNAKVATASAYGALNAASLTTSESNSILSSSLADMFSAGSGRGPLRNDFEGVIFEIEPEIERAKRVLLDAGARGALLAGSGSSVFGVFDDEVARNRALENLKREAGWRAFSCETISRDEYFRAMNSSGFPLFTLS